MTELLTVPGASQGKKPYHNRRGSMPTISSIVRSISSSTLSSLVSKAPQNIREDDDTSDNPLFLQEAAVSKNKDWNTVQLAFLKLFQDRELPQFSLVELREIVQKLSEGQIGPFIYEYYRDKMLKKGMQTLKEDIDDASLLSLLEIWDYFYKEILPRLQIIFQPVEVKNLTIRQMSLVAFRDQVLLQSQMIELLESLDPEQTDVPPALEQMLLVLQSVRESDPPSDDFLKLERLVALLIQPYLGYRGLYMGGPEPVVGRCAQLNPFAYLRLRTWSGESESGDVEKRPSGSILRVSSPGTSPLGTLKENLIYDGSRRHSYSVTFT